jgi:hypothetical protein
MTTATFDNVTRIMEAALKSPVGVWVIDKKVKIVPTSSTKRFEAMFNDYWKECRGVYDKRATAAMIKEDLK